MVNSLELEKKARTKIEEKKLPERQAEVLKFIRDTTVSLGSPPSYREIQKHFHFKAIKTVQDHIQALTKKGLLVSTQANRKQRRSRHLIPHDLTLEKIKRIPIYGEVAAGGPREAEQLELGTLIIPEEDGQARSFGLRVVGNSMIEAGILEGDVLIVEQTNTIKNGDIVVALLNGETTVKRFFKKADGVHLVPENKSMKPIVVTSERFEVQGKVVGLQRKI